MSRKRKLLFFALLALEVVLLLSIAPGTMPQGRKAKTLFSKWQESHSQADEAAFRAEMDRLTAGQRRVRKVGGVLLTANSGILIIISRRKDQINALRITLSLVFLLPSALGFGQQGSPPTTSVKPGGGLGLCKVGPMPPDIQKRLKEEFGSWKVQEPTDLSARARERWKSEKPLECPGLAVGQFESAKMPCYAVLLVPVGHSDGGYRFLIFSRKASQSSYEMTVVDQLDETGAANFFIHKVRISKFYDERSRRKFNVQGSEGILLVDAAEKEYEVDVYFWTNGRYQHKPVDY